MTAIIWKEWRENAGWALLGMVGGGLLMALMLIDNARHQESLATDEFSGLIACIGAIVGAAIGFLQVIFETRQGYWAALVHRPISRERLFVGKVVAGLSLYFAAMLIPFGLCVIWVQIPGNVAGPFRWNMTIPGLIDILTGTVYYFAGVLVARRSARWYAGRCLPLVAALLCTFLVMVMYQAKLALLVILVFDVLLFVAARGAFLAGGETRTQSPVAKTSLALILLLGVTLTGSFGVIVAASFIPNPVYSDRGPVRYTQHVLLRDGRVVVLENVDQKRVAARDMDGHALPELLYEPEPGKPDPLQALTPPQVTLTLNMSDHRHFSDRPYRYRYRLRHLRAGLENVEGECWYYLPQIGRFVGYDTVSRRQIGSLGPEGFAIPGEQAADRFRGERPWYGPPGPITDLFPTTEAIYQVSLTKRTARLLFEPGPGTQISMVGGIVKAKPGPYNEMYGYGMYPGTYETEYEYAGYAMSTGKSIVLMDNNLNVLAEYTPSVDTAKYRWLHVYKLDEPETYAFWYIPASEEGQPATLTLPRQFEVYQIGQDLVSAVELPPDTDNRGDWPSQLTAVKPYWGLLLPQAPTAVLASLPLYRYTEIGFIQAMLTRSMNTGMIVCLVVGAVFGLLCNLWLARRNALPTGARVVWAGAGLLLGPSGVLLMLCMLDQPARVRCDGCGRPRLVCRDRCEHCGAGFAPPPTDGTEIFDRPDTGSGTGRAASPQEIYG